MNGGLQGVEMLVKTATGGGNHPQKLIRGHPTADLKRPFMIN